MAALLVTRFADYITKARPKIKLIKTKKPKKIKKKCTRAEWRRRKGHSRNSIVQSQWMQGKERDGRIEREQKKDRKRERKTKREQDREKGERQGGRKHFCQVYNNNKTAL